METIIHFYTLVKTQQFKIADKADMIIANYSFTVTDNGDVKMYII